MEMEKEMATHSSILAWKILRTEESGGLQPMGLQRVGIWAYAVTNPGVNALRTPVYAEMVNIVNGIPVTFNDYRFDLVNVKNVMNNFGYYNARPITKAMLTWWAYTMQDQPLYSLETILEIEHIYAKNRNEKSFPCNLLQPKVALERNLSRMRCYFARRYFRVAMPQYAALDCFF